ncbi:MAG: hypothetical protein JOY66_22360 [Acetobacteraceae bacterium]|nr:hypothetical protein [Acetobacteraceae bacterium]
MTKIRLLTAAVAFSLLGSLAASPPANAIGCISGGVAGAAAGHLAHHGVLGAIGGCIAGHEANKYQQRRAAARAQNQDSMSNPAQSPQDSGTIGSSTGTMGTSTGTAR